MLAGQRFTVVLLVFLCEACLRHHHEFRRQQRRSLTSGFNAAELGGHE